MRRLAIIALLFAVVLVLLTALTWPLAPDVLYVWIATLMGIKC